MLDCGAAEKANGPVGVWGVFPVAENWNVDF